MMTAMLDVLVVGAGPAGSIAATVLARTGARVRIVDRASFPREKLCGDTINPGTVEILRRLKVAGGIDARGLPITGMRVTGERGVSVEARYPDGLNGIAVTRSELDWQLLQHAMRAGASFDSSVVVRDALVSENRPGRTLSGVTAASGGRLSDIRARVTIAADGRRSTLAFGLGLARHPPRPRRWAIGAYFQGSPQATVGEMHIRRGRYIGVAPLAGGLANVCLVKPASAGDCDFRDPTALLIREIEREPELRDRFRAAQMVRPPVMLGPLAVDATGGSVDGLILAGDAAGFVDPMTGDGLRFAVRGGELAAVAALEALEHGWDGVHARLATRRQREFASKWRFNRALRALVGTPAAVRTGAAAARVAPALIQSLVAFAGDCNIA
jgi:flavin-dependent dehydrogenase